MNDTTEHNKVNEAIVRYIGSGWSAEVERAITEAYGAGVTHAVQSVYRAAIDCPVDWRTATMESALDTMLAFLTAHYPWLSSEARTRLNYCFIMTWK